MICKIDRKAAFCGSLSHAVQTFLSIFLKIKTTMRGFMALLMAAMIVVGMIPIHSEAKKVTYYKTQKIYLQTKESKIVKTTKKWSYVKI